MLKSELGHTASPSSNTRRRSRMRELRGDGSGLSIAGPVEWYVGVEERTGSHCVAVLGHRRGFRMRVAFVIISRIHQDA